MSMESIISASPNGPRPAAAAAPAGRSRPAPKAADPVRDAQTDALRKSVAEQRAKVMAEQKAALQDTVDSAAAKLEALNQSLTFQVHDGTGELMVQVVDRSTGDVLRETPPKEFLDLAVRLEEMVGFFFDETR